MSDSATTMHAGPKGQLDAVTRRELSLGLAMSTVVHALLFSAVTVVFTTHVEPSVRFDRVDLTLVRPERPVEQTDEAVELPAESAPAPVPQPQAAAPAAPTPQMRPAQPKPQATSEAEQGTSAPAAGLPLGEGLPGTGWNVPVGEGSDIGLQTAERAPPQPKSPAEAVKPPPVRRRPAQVTEEAESHQLKIVQRPRPPSGLERLAFKHYPQRALNERKTGVARLMVKVHPDGSATVVRQLSRSEEGFEAACQRVLADAGRWDPPRDEEGSAVSTMVRFVCRFTTADR